MEQQENNNLSELEQLKQQYETLKEQFDQQEIVNDRLMKSSIKSNVDFFMRYRWKQYILYPVAVLVGLLVVKWDFGNELSLRLFWIAYCLLGFAFELWMLRKLHVKTLENNDLLTLSNQARSFKVLYTVFVILSAVPMLILSVGLFFHAGYDHLPSFESLLVVFAVLLAIFLSVGIADIRHKTKHCNEIIHQIEASEFTEYKKTGFNKKQKWFFVAMVVAFLCFDVWTYMIVASHKKLPPMWHTMQFVREAGDLSTEGKLEFWEVYSDTLVTEEDVPVVMENWHVCDSLVVMKSKESSFEMGLDKESYHVWKNEDDSGHQMRLYALKKTTLEGPAISSEVMGGKPMVAYVEFTYPRRYPNTEPVPIYVFLTSETRQLWYRFTTEIAGQRTAIVMDDVVIQDWQVMCGIDNGKFMITREWSSKEEVEAFCEQLIKQ